MLKSDFEFIRDILEQEVGSVRAREFEGITLQMYLPMEGVWELVSKPDPAFYLARLTAHARLIVPQYIEYLKTGECIAATDSIVHFVIDVCHRTGLALADFISMRELGQVRREALLRSARFPLENPDDWMVSNSNMKEGWTAHALLAGISANEIGVTEEYAEKSLRSYLHKDDPELKDYWEAACDHAQYLNSLFESAK